MPRIGVEKPEDFYKELKLLKRVKSKPNLQIEENFYKEEIKRSI